MPTYDNDINKWIKAADIIRADIIRAPIELQLVWVFELLLLMAFVKNHKDNKFIKWNSEKASLDSKRCFSFYDKQYARTINILGKFRNTFVHFGFAAASAYFRDIMDTCSDLDQLCEQYVKIKLNRGNRIF